MLVKDVMSKSIISVGSDDRLGTVLSKMEKNKVHQLLVLDENNFKGMINLKSIIARDYDTERTKVNSLIVHVPTIEINETIERARDILINAAIKAVPVTENKKIVGVVSETDLISTIKTDRIAKDLMTECEVVSKDDKIGKLRSMFFKKNISRVPVVSDGNVVGIVDMLDMIKIYRGKKYEARGKLTDRGFRQKTRLDDVPVTVVMRKPFTIKEDTSIKEIAEILQKKEEVLIDYHGDYFIIVPKDIIEILKPEKKEGVYVQITNLKDEDSFTTGKIDIGVEEFIHKTGRMLKDINSLNIHIDRYEKTGRRIRYHIRTRFHTHLGLFVSSAQGWNIVTVVQQALKKLEREIMTKYGKIKKHPKKREELKKRVI